MIDMLLSVFLSGVIVWSVVLGECEYPNRAFLDIHYRYRKWHRSTGSCQIQGYSVPVGSWNAGWRSAKTCFPLTRLHENTRLVPLSFANNVRAIGFEGAGSNSRVILEGIWVFSLCLSSFVWNAMTYSQVIWFLVLWQRTLFMPVLLFTD